MNVSALRRVWTNEMLPGIAMNTNGYLTTAEMIVKTVELKYKILQFVLAKANHKFRKKKATRNMT